MRRDLEDTLSERLCLCSLFGLAISGIGKALSVQRLGTHIRRKRCGLGFPRSDEGMGTSLLGLEVVYR